MNRRDAMSRVALLMGGVLSGPTLMAMENGKLTANLSLANYSLSAAQRAVVAQVAEHILPKTDTPGAIDAGCPAFIELMIKDCYKAIDQASFTAGVDALVSSNFTGQTKEAQIAALKKLEADTNLEMAQRNVKQVKVGDNVDKESMDAAAKGVPFWRLIKELTLLGYYTSEVGVNASFVYEPVPGKFIRTKLKKGQKAFAY